MGNLLASGILLSFSIVFIVLGFIFNNIKTKYFESRLIRANTDKRVGILICFRYMIKYSDASDSFKEDYFESKENDIDYHPVMRFKVDGIEVTERLEIPTSTISNTDIGRSFPICYTDTPSLIESPYVAESDKKYRVLLDTDDYWFAYNKVIINKVRTFGNISKVMIIIGIVLTILVHFV